MIGTSPVWICALASFRQEVLAKGHVDRVEIVFQGETIAVHMRCYGVAQPNGPLRNAMARGGIKNRPLLELASYAEESHLRVLPEPCVNLSTHTAPDVSAIAMTKLPVGKER